MAVQIAEAVSSAILGISWAGIVMLYDFSMGKKNILNWWYWKINPAKKWMRKKQKAKISFSKIILFKIIGGCPPCFGLWFGLLALLLPINYFIFLGVSQLILTYKYGS